MAELVLRPLINKILDIIGEGASLLYWLESDIKWLQGHLELMEAYLSVARAKQDEDSRVATLIKQIEELAIDADDLLDTYLPPIKPHDREGHFVWLKKVSRSIGSVPNSFIFALEIQKIKKRVQQIEEKRRAYGITETDGHHEENIHASLFLHADEPSIFIGRDKNAEELEDKLLDQTVKYGVISIVGMAGSGKTTLAKRIYDSVKAQFGCSAKEYVSRVPNVKELLRSIARQVGVQENKLKEDLLELKDLQRKLLSILKGQKYLILLDDIWELDSWDDLKLIFPSKPEDGSRLIITSRNNDVGRYIGGESSLHALESLTLKDSITLFWYSIMTHQEDTSFPSDLEDIGRQIVEKCGGLPLAIVLTAGTLRTRERNERSWNLVLNSMGSSEEDKCSKILALSYMGLPSQLKPCFLYLGLFPEDYEISAFRLINMWVAEKFIRGNGTQEVEEVGEKYLYELAARNLVEVVKRGFDGRIESCHLHDLLHQFCINVAEKNNFFYTLDSLKRLDPNSIIKVRRLTTHFHGMDEYSALNPQMPKLRALLCFARIYKVEEHHRRKIFAEQRLLRVLIIDLTYRSKDAPKVIKKMRQLTYLEVDWIHARSSRFKKLKNLQTVIGSCLDVDSDHIWKMQRLRHLVGLDGLFSAPTEVALPNLQTLDIIDLRFWDPQMLYLLQNLPSLRRLTVTGQVEPIIEALSSRTAMMPKIEILKFGSLYSPDPHSVNRVDLSSYHDLGCLRLNVVLEKLPIFNEFPPNLIKLTLEDSNLVDDPMKTLQRLPKLKILKLKPGSYVGQSMHCSGRDSFRHLKLLVLRGLPNLVEIKVDDGSLRQLKTVDIEHCPLLREIPARLRDLMSTKDPKVEPLKVSIATSSKDEGSTSGEIKM